MKILLSKLLYNIMGTVQILTKYKCCSETEYEEDDDDEKPSLIKQKATVSENDAVLEKAESFQTLPGVTNN